MKILGGLVLGALIGAGGAWAGTVTVASTCGTFSYSGLSAGASTSGSWTCEGLGSIVSVPANVTSVSGYVVYDTDYSNGISPTVDETAMFSFSGFSGLESAAWLTDQVETTGTSSSNNTVSNTEGAPFHAAVVGTPFILAGFYDALTGLSTTTASDQSFTVGYSSNFLSGFAVSGTGYAQVVYTYSTDTTPTPEPVTYGLIGAALIGLGFVRRHKKV
jgi:hypothetical protein